jgi:hypothetical protein
MTNMPDEHRPKPGDWVLLNGDDVVACGRDVKSLIALAGQYTPGALVISKEPVSKHCYY